MKEFFIFISSLIVVFLASCKCEYCMSNFFYLDNESETIISFYVPLIGMEGVVYPDTTLAILKTNIGYSIQSNNRARVELSNISLEDWISSFPKDTVSIFIFSRDTLDRYSWSEIQSGYKIQQRYDLSLDDFKKLSDKNGVPVITYPPSEAMKDMKMCPRYKEE